MKDRFKFRAWDKEMFDILTIYFDGNEEHSQLDLQSIKRKENGDFVHKTVGIKDIILMQCTGLKDKNGKLIYEGDVFKWTVKKGTECEEKTNILDKVHLSMIDSLINIFDEEGVVPNIISNDCEFISEVKYVDGEFILELIKDRNFVTVFIDSKLKRNELGEVIGNIYENQELIKEVENDK